MNDEELNDEELIRYFELHSRIKRAKFSRDHIVRLSELAGHPAQHPDRIPRLSAVHVHVVDEYIKEARYRMGLRSFRLIRGGKR